MDQYILGGLLLGSIGWVISNVNSFKTKKLDADEKGGSSDLMNNSFDPRLMRTREDIRSNTNSVIQLAKSPVNGISDPTEVQSFLVSRLRATDNTKPLNEDEAIQGLYIQKVGGWNKGIDYNPINVDV